MMNERMLKAEIRWYSRFFKPISKTRPRTKRREDALAWEWKRKHPKQWTWLMNNYASNDFARSVAQYIHLFGQPTDAQQQALDRRSYQ